jgi:3D (Asp-Asp-Asp) domain-containing protein
MFNYKKKTSSMTTKYAPSLMVSLFGVTQEMKKVKRSSSMAKTSFDPRILPSYAKVRLENPIRIGKGSNVYLKDQDINRDNRVLQDTIKREKKAREKLFGRNP